MQSEYIDLRRKYREVVDKHERLQERARQQVLTTGILRTSAYGYMYVMAVYHLL